jgi:hypothetical protein
LLIQLEPKLPAVQRQEVQPRDNNERLAFVEVCMAKQQNLTAVRLYKEAFTMTPVLAQKLDSHRYNAACCAVLAANSKDGESAGLENKRRCQLRQQALDWLRADLAGFTALLNKNGTKALPEVTRVMKHWLADADFNSVRGAEAISGLAESERSDWQQLWQEVEALLSQAVRSGSMKT